MPSDEGEGANVLDEAIQAWRSLRGMFRIVIREDCPPDKLYLIDPTALGIDAEKQIVVVPDKATGETIEAAMRRAGVKVTGLSGADPCLAIERVTPCCETCDGDGYLDINDPETGNVIGPRPCPDCDGTPHPDSWVARASAKAAVSDEKG